MRTNCFYLLLTALAGFAGFPDAHASAPDSSERMFLYTPYTDISVSPGASIGYDIDLINRKSEVADLPLSVEGMPAGWKYGMKAGGWDIGRLAVLPGEKKSFNFKVEVPLKVNRGSYRFAVAAGGVTLPLTVTVTQQGTYRTEFTTGQPNMQGNSKSTFNFEAVLDNRTAERQSYALMADAPRGWNVVFRPNNTQATSAQLEPNTIQSIGIDIAPPSNVTAGSYKIPVRASAGPTSAELELEVVITGTFQMELTTPQGLLSSDITAGEARRLNLMVKNTGSSLLRGIQLMAARPADWEVSFEPSRIETLKAGETALATAVLKASKKALPGDYLVTVHASSPEVSSSAQFRIAVKTSMLWGWVGVGIILLAAGAVYGLFRKYGRR